MRRSGVREDDINPACSLAAHPWLDLARFVEGRRGLPVVVVINDVLGNTVSHSSADHRRFVWVGV